ncbi:hypothetical protein F4775DRAFT_588651 [Biscogniauxia sp. FL1348]|nr:hypothetical protein F4775DRAFT_588651 [Biscogniauxia sp. FL1348]
MTRYVHVEVVSKPLHLRASLKSFQVARLVLSHSNFGAESFSCDRIAYSYVHNHNPLAKAVSATATTITSSSASSSSSSTSPYSSGPTKTQAPHTQTEVWTASDAAQASRAGAFLTAWPCDEVYSAPAPVDEFAGQSGGRP